MNVRRTTLGIKHSMDMVYVLQVAQEWVAVRHDAAKAKEVSDALRNGCCSILWHPHVACLPRNTLCCVSWTLRI